MPLHLGILNSEMGENKLSQSNRVLNLKSHLSWRNLAGDLESSLIYMQFGWEPIETLLALLSKQVLGRGNSQKVNLECSLVQA